MHFEFPVVRAERDAFPDEAICPCCKRAKVFEPHSFASLSGGALLIDDAEGGSAAIPGGLRLQAYLDFLWHGAHEGGSGTDRDIHEVLSVADRVEGGQYELYFCSASCLRAFLNAAVDSLEARIAAANSAE